MKLNKIISSMILMGAFCFNANASEVGIDNVKENIKTKFEQIYKFNPNMEVKFLPDAKLYELNLGNQKAYTNDDVDYLFLQGQVFVSTDKGLINLTMPPEEFLKSKNEKEKTAIQKNNVKASMEKPEIEKLKNQQTYENKYDEYQKSLIASRSLEDLKISSNFKYVGFEGGASLPETTVGYVSKVDISNAIKVVYGNGERSIILFADPDCPFCQNFDKTLYLNADNLNATVYVLPWALSIHPNAESKANFIWSQPDRGNAWKSWMLFSAEHPVKDNPELVWNEWVKITGRTENKDIKAPLESTRKHVEEFGFRYTPTVLFPNGAISEGDVEASKLRQYLEVFDKKIPTSN